MTDHYRKLEKMYLAAPVNQSLEIEVTITDRETTIIQGIKPEHCHSAGALHGNYYFKCLDDACYFAASSINFEYFVLTVDFHIRLLRPVTPDLKYIKAHGKVVSSTKRLIICEGILWDSQDREIARGTGSFMPGRGQLTDFSGYRDEN